MSLWVLIVVGVTVWILLMWLGVGLVRIAAADDDAGRRSIAEQGDFRVAAHGRARGLRERRGADRPWWGASWDRPESQTEGDLRLAQSAVAAARVELVRAEFARDQLMRSAAARGVPLTRIAEATGMSPIDVGQRIGLSRLTPPGQASGG